MAGAEQVLTATENYRPNWVKICPSEKELQRDLFEEENQESDVVRRVNRAFDKLSRYVLLYLGEPMGEMEDVAFAEVQLKHIQFKLKLPDFLTYKTREFQRWVRKGDSETKKDVVMRKVNSAGEIMEEWKIKGLEINHWTERVRCDDVMEIKGMFEWIEKCK